MTTMIERIDQRLSALGLSDRAASMLATSGTNPDLIRDVRRKGFRPKREALDGLAEALETTVEFMLNGRATGAIVGGRATGYDAPPEASPFGAPLPRTLPVYGTALGADLDFDQDAPAIELHLLEMTDVIDWVRRPPILEGRKDIYALYVSGSSMEPRFDAGDPVIVDPKRPPRPGDDVIVQVVDHVGEDVEVKAVLIKRLVRRTSSFLELRQYNPSATFTVPIAQILQVHRVLRMADVIG